MQDVLTCPSRGLAAAIRCADNRPSWSSFPWQVLIPSRCPSAGHRADRPPAAGHRSNRRRPVRRRAGADLAAQLRHPPPLLSPDDERYPGRDPRYAGLSQEQLPLTESLKETVARVIPYWHAEIAPVIQSGRRVIVAAHGNSLRALVKFLDNLSEEAILQLNIPTGVPLVYELNEQLQPLRSYYLGDPAEIAAAAAAVAAQGKAR